MLKQRRDFFQSEQGKSIMRVLKSMSDDSKYNTPSTYTPNSIRYPDNLKPFVDKHMDYLNAHPNLDAWTYVSNVKMGTRVNR